MNKSLNESISEVKVALQNTKLKKSGHNKSADFDYFELADFQPTLNVEMAKVGINDLFSIHDNVASLTLIKGEERQVYEIPFVMFDTPIYTRKDFKTGEISQVKSMQDIQYLGALNTYYKRYLYLNAFGITDGEIIDSMDNTGLESVDYNAELKKYLESHALDIKEVAREYKLNSKTTNARFKEVLDELKSQETGEV